MVICNTAEKIQTKLNEHLGHSLNFAELLFGFCEDCSKQLNMPSVTPGAFAVCKIRAAQQYERGLTVSKIKTEKPEAKVNADKKWEYTPFKYNSKMMNAIWGHYNRYSPHNIKSNDSDGSNNEQIGQQPQQYAVGGAVGYDIVQRLAMSNGATDWTFRV